MKKKTAINGKEIYERIIKIIKIRGIKNKDFCEKTGVTRQALAKWKSGSLPSIDILYVIKEELNISLEYLVTGKFSQNGENDLNLKEYKIKSDLENIKVKINLILDEINQINTERNVSLQKGENMEQPEKKETEDLYFGDYNSEHKAINVYTREEYIERFGKEPEESQRIVNKN